jgi:hypothetical protein
LAFEERGKHKLTSQTQREPEDKARAAPALPSEEIKAEIIVRIQERTATMIWAIRDNVTPRRVRRMLVYNFSHQTAFSGKTIRLARLPSSWDRRNGSCWLSWRKIRTFLLV